MALCVCCVQKIEASDRRFPYFDSKWISENVPSLCDTTRVHLMAPMNFWQNSTLSFGVAAFCLTKIGFLEDEPTARTHSAPHSNVWQFCGTVTILYNFQQKISWVFQNIQHFYPEEAGKLHNTKWYVIWDTLKNIMYY